MKYDHSNIIDGENEEDTDIEDIDDTIANNLQSTNALVAMFTLVKLSKILDPYTF